MSRITARASGRTAVHQDFMEISDPPNRLACEFERCSRFDMAYLIFSSVESLVKGNINKIDDGVRRYVALD